MSYLGDDLRTSDFDFDLPERYIAQSPACPRDSCRLMVLARDGSIEHRVFSDIGDYLAPGDLLVVNDTRVLPARLLGHKRGTGGAAEVLLTDKVAGAPDSGSEQTWNCLVKPGKRLKTGAVVEFAEAAETVDAAGGSKAAVTSFAPQATQPLLTGEIVDVNADGTRRVRLTPADTASTTSTTSTTSTADTAAPATVDALVHRLGRTPLPPYITSYAGDDEQYQTVYSREEASAAAPTAGLHFTTELLDSLRASGIRTAHVTLEVGLDTFRLVSEDDPTEHAMHTERYTVPPETARAVLRAKRDGGRVVAVGTTSVRSLESAAASGEIESVERASTGLFILPGYEFRVVDAIITNFHVPRSTLMMLVSAFSGRDNIMHAYEEAKREEYRFFSFGDAMLLL